MISACLIVKNEEANLEKCLNSIKNLADEIIVVDTGSTDKTREIARKFTDKVLDYVWKNDFSNARNFASKQATGEWIFSIDADEIINEKDAEKIKELVQKDGKEFLGFSFIQRNYSPRGNTERKMLRLFRKDEKIFFEGLVHETVEKSVLKEGKMKDTDIIIHHYSKADSEKIKWYVELGKKEQNIGYWSAYQLGTQLHSLGEIEEAEKYLKLSTEKNPIFYLSFLELGVIYLKRNKISEAKEVLEKAYSLNNSDAAVIEHLGIVYARMNDAEKAIEYLTRAIELDKNNADFYFNLGMAYDGAGKKKEAYFSFKRAVELNPEYNKIIHMG